IELVGAKRAVVGEPCPGDGKMLLSHAEKAAEAEHGVSNVPTELIDHKTLDGAGLLTAGAAHRGAFDPVARDQAVELAARRIALHGCLHHASNRSDTHPPASTGNRFERAAVPIDQNSGGTTPTRNGPRKTVPSSNRIGNATAGLPSSSVRSPSAAIRPGAAFWRAMPPSPGIRRSSALNVAPTCPSVIMRSRSNILRIFSIPTTVTRRVPSRPPRAVSLRAPAPIAITSCCAKRAFSILNSPPRVCHSLNQAGQGLGERSSRPR